MSDFDNYENPKEGKTYISPRLKSFGQGTEKVRIVSKVLEHPEAYAFGTIKDEVVLRHEEGSSKYIKAKFIEDPRGLFLISFQGYSSATDKPHNASFSFIGDEIGKLVEFIKNGFDYAFDNNNAVNIEDDELKESIISSNRARQLLKDNEEVFSEIIKSEITKEDIITIGYRKKQLRSL